VLSIDEARSVDVMGEVILPGSSASGLAHYIDHQLAATAAGCMLMLRYLNVPAPFVSFYRGGIAAADTAASTLYGHPLAGLTAEEATRLVSQMADDSLAGWQGPPAPFFFFVMRADAVDVTYGTKAGFARLNVPYMAHNEPPSRWGEER
jgi:hypothetical protein